MRQRAPILIMLVAVAVTTSGCAAGMKRLYDEQTAEIAAMQAQIDQLAQQEGPDTQELEAIRRDVAQIGTKVTQVEDAISELSRKNENVNTRLALLTEEVTRLKTEPPAQPATPPASESVVLFGEPPATASGNTKALYDNALRLYYDEQPREAIAEFTRVLETAPTSDLADNAEYWIGECYYKLEEFEPALAAFKRVFDHQGSNKYEDAQLKIGMTYQNMGRRDEALAAYRELIQKYPNSQHVALVRQKIAEIGG
jgi:tol-pal system protein YbgF